MEGDHAGPPLFFAEFRDLLAGYAPVVGFDFVDDYYCGCWIFA